MKAIKTPDEHAAALECAGRLAARGDHRTQPEQDQLEVLLVLIEKYEEETQPVIPPSPLEAIRFRMDQMGYRPKDLARLLGGASRASEVLSGKRGLSPEMMRRLRDEWRIPADSLLGGHPPPEPEPPPAPGRGPASGRDPKNYPLKQMFNLGYFPGQSGEWRNHSRDQDGLLAAFFESATPLRRSLVLARQGGGAKSRINPHAVEAWYCRVLIRANEEKAALPAYDPAALDTGFLNWLTGLTCLADGPRQVRSELEAKGIAVVIEPRLDHTHLDGAAMIGAGGRPVIGLTLRHNRLDNFWFTLFHELGHVLRHLSPETPVLLDSDIDQRKEGRMETEADRFALDTLIHPAQWPALCHLNYADEIRAAAKRLRLHPSVIAGRLRREANDYRKHPTLVGQKLARAAFGFTEENWPK